MVPVAAADLWLNQGPSIHQKKLFSNSKCYAAVTLTLVTLSTGLTSHVQFMVQQWFQNDRNIEVAYNCSALPTLQIFWKK